MTPEHFEFEEELFEYKDQKREADEEVKLINTALEVVEKYVPKTSLALSTEEFELITSEVEKELGELALNQELVIDALAKNQAARYHLSSQLSIAKRSVIELDDDYKFSVEYIEGDEVECPLCGTAHDNSIVSRASILVDKQDAEDQVALISDEINDIEEAISDLQNSLDDIRLRISYINEKYRKVDDVSGEEVINLNSIVDGFASRSVQRNVEETKAQKESLSKNIHDKQAELKKEQKNLISKEVREELGSMFLGLLTEFLEKLNAKGVNLNRVKHPSDYNKIFGSGGAAEGTRAALAYQMAVFRQIYTVANELPPPLVVDTPNQQEQANQHYDKIIDLLMNDSPKNSQIIMCGMDNPQLYPYAKEAHVIELNENKLLEKQPYNVLSEELAGIFSSTEINL